MRFLLYGAYGYTGRIIINECKNYELTPILAGRSEEPLKKLANYYNYEYRVIDLSDKEKLQATLQEVDVVIHAAGPFIHTAKQMIEACLVTKTHYLDITGEIPVFEMAKQYNQQAKNAGIMILPGAGFDVVPTDCLAVFLKDKLPDATHLKLAFAGGSGFSHGTATTAIENLGSGGVIRKNGKIEAVALGHKTLEIPFAGKRLNTMTIPWGDISTAYTSTGIPNIEVYTSVPPKMMKYVKWEGRLSWLLRQNWVKNMLKKRLDQQAPGPSDEIRAKAQSYIWGEVSNAAGDRREARLTTPEGYTLTALTSLHIAKKVVCGDYKIGYQTPAMAYGADLITDIAGVFREEPYVC